MADRRGAEFDDFVRGRSPALLRTAYLLTGDGHAAEDLLQEVLEQLYVRWPQVHSSPDGYVRRILVTRATNRWRRRRRRPERLLGDLTVAGADLATPDPSDDTVTRDVVVTALQALPTRQRAAVVLRFLEDLPVTEVARALDCSEGAVKSNTARGLARLRESFVDSGLVMPAADPERSTR
jgi:RNA polymerase sigma-70 factor (sigma-E family)